MFWERNDGPVKTPRIYSLDAVRVSLTLCIVLCHASFLLPDKINDYVGTLTSFALELFFVISGFVAVAARNALEQDVPATGKFLWAKLKKIWPLHFLMYLACFVLQNLENPAAFSIADSVKQTVVNLLLLQSWTPNEAYVYSYNGVTWFLSSLAFCYLLTPIALRFLKRYRPHAGLVLAATVAIRFLYVTCFEYFIGVGGFCYVNVFPPYRFMEYFAGMALGAVYLNADKRHKSSLAQIFGVVSFLLIFILCKWNETIWNIQSLFICIELFLVYILSAYEGCVDMIAKWKVVQYLNGIALPIFLIHQVVLKYVRYFAGLAGVDLGQKAYLSLAVCIVLIVLLCAGYEKCEKLLKSRKV